MVVDARQHTPPNARLPSASRAVLAPWMWGKATVQAFAEAGKHEKTWDTVLGGLSTAPCLDRLTNESIKRVVSTPGRPWIRSIATAPHRSPSSPPPPASPTPAPLRYLSFDPILCLPACLPYLHGRRVLSLRPVCSLVRKSGHFEALRLVVDAEGNARIDDRCDETFRCSARNVHTPTNG